MAKVYAELIKKGLKTIDNVPKHLKEAVLALLEEEEKETTAQAAE